MKAEITFSAQRSLIVDSSNSPVDPHEVGETIVFEAFLLLATLSVEDIREDERALGGNREATFLRSDRFWQIEFAPASGDALLQIREFADSTESGQVFSIKPYGDEEQVLRLRRLEEGHTETPFIRAGGERTDQFTVTVRAVEAVDGSDTFHVYGFESPLGGFDPGGGSSGGGDGTFGPGFASSIQFVGDYWLGPPDAPGTLFHGPNSTVTGPADAAQIFDGITQDFTVEAKIKVTSWEAGPFGEWDGDQLIVGNAPHEVATTPIQIVDPVGQWALAVENIDGDYGHLVMQMATAPDNEYSFFFASDEPVIELNQTYHVAAVVDRAAKTVTLYVDGDVVPSSEYFGDELESADGYGFANAGEYLYIGGYDTHVHNYNGYYGGFIGEIDEVRLWNVARSGAEIEELYDSPAVGDETGLVGLYHFDEGTGDTTADDSPTGNALSLENGATWVESTTVIGPDWNDEGEATDNGETNTPPAEVPPANEPPDTDPPTGAFRFEVDYDGGSILPGRPSGNTPTSSTEQSYAGGRSGRYFLDRLTSGTPYRTESTFSQYRLQKNAEYWYGFAVLFTTPYVPHSHDRYFEIIAQLHAGQFFNQDGTGGLNPPFNLHVKRTTLHLTATIRGDSRLATQIYDPVNGPEYQNAAQYDLGAITFNTWMRFVGNLRVASDNSGFHKIWVNDVLKCNNTGPNCYGDAEGPYFKHGLYVGWKAAQSYGAGDTARTRLVFFDEVRWADGAANYAKVDPATYL